jgi:hypothetical protein
MKKILILGFIMLLSISTFAADKLVTEILGQSTPLHFFVLFVWAMVGVIISLLIHATNRDVASTRTPVKFNFLFLLKDNAGRVVLNLLLIIVTLRFCKEITGFDINQFVAFCIGICYDKLAELLRNANIIIKKPS